MTTTTERLLARIDRLPASWRIIAIGFLIQLGLALLLLGVTYGDNDRIGVAVAAVLTVIVLLCGLAALPAAIVLRDGRYQRAGASLAAITGILILLVNEGHPTIWPFSLALFVAAVRGWVRATVDAAELVRVDPDRFERVEPPEADSEE